MNDDKLIEAVARAIKEQLPSLGFNNPLNPFPDDVGNGKWAESIANNCAEAALRAVREWQWQPIESAPRDGTTIIGYGRRWLHPTKYDIDKIKWISDEDIIEFEGFATGQLALAPRDGESVKKLMSFGVDDFFTHWMPLPQPPQEGE
jgi:hypothetical protein